MEISSSFLVRVFVWVCPCERLVFVRLLPVQPSCWLWPPWPWRLRGSPGNLPPPCACVCQSGCACMLMLACQSKPPLGSQSHQLLIKLVCRGSTSVLTDVTDAGKCISVCIGAAAVDFYAISAEWGAAVYRAVGICKVCVYVCLQSSTYSWCSFINHKSLTAKTAATSANCFCLPSDQLSSVLSLFYILSFSPFPSRTSPFFSLPALLSSQLTSFMVACLNWCFFSPLTSCASWHAWWFTNTHTQKAI